MSASHLYTQQQQYPWQSRPTMVNASAEIRPRMTQGVFSHLNQSSKIPSKRVEPSSATSSKRLLELQKAQQMENSITQAKKNSASFNAQSLLYGTSSSNMQPMHSSLNQSTVMGRFAQTDHFLDSQDYHGGRSMADSQTLVQHPLIMSNRQAILAQSYLVNSNFKTPQQNLKQSYGREDQKIDGPLSKAELQELEPSAMPSLEPPVDYECSIKPPDMGLPASQNASMMAVQDERSSIAQHEKDQKNQNHHGQDNNKASEKLEKTITGYKDQILKMKQYLTHIEGSMTQKSTIQYDPESLEDGLNTSIVHCQNMNSFAGFASNPNVKFNEIQSPELHDPQNLQNQSKQFNTFNYDRQTPSGRKPSRHSYVQKAPNESQQYLVTQGSQNADLNSADIMTNPSHQKQMVHQSQRLLPNQQPLLQNLAGSCSSRRSRVSPVMAQVNSLKRENEELRAKLRSKKSQNSANSRRSNSRQPSHLSLHSTNSKPKGTARKGSALKRKLSIGSQRTRPEKSSLANLDPAFRSHQLPSKHDKDSHNVAAVEFKISHNHTPIQERHQSFEGASHGSQGSSKSQQSQRENLMALKSGTMGSLHLLGQLTETENGSQSTMECQLPFHRLSTAQTKREPSFVGMTPVEVQYLENNFDDHIQHLQSHTKRKSTASKQRKRKSSGLSNIRQSCLRQNHVQKCTQCDYWMHKAQIYLQKIDKHMRQQNGSSVGAATAKFNSMANVNALMNGTMQSFGRMTMTKNVAGASLSKARKSLSQGVAGSGTRKKGKAVTHSHYDQPTQQPDRKGTSLRNPLKASKNLAKPKCGNSQSQLGIAYARKSIQNSQTTKRGRSKAQQQQQMPPKRQTTSRARQQSKIASRKASAGSKPKRGQNSNMKQSLNIMVPNVRDDSPQAVAMAVQKFPLRRALTPPPLINGQKKSTSSNYDRNDSRQKSHGRGNSSTKEFKNSGRTEDSTEKKIEKQLSMEDLIQHCQPGSNPTEFSQLPPQMQQMYINDNFTQSSEEDFQARGVGVTSSREFLTSTDHNFADFEETVQATQDSHQLMTLNNFGIKQ